MDKLKGEAPYQMSSGEAARLLGVNLSTGLPLDEVRRRRSEFGMNRITAPRGIPALLKFRRQFQQPLVYMLLLAAGITAGLGEWVDSAVISSVVIFNAIVGFLQESKAEKSIESLSRMVTAEATVRRDGQKLRINAEALVPGDVVFLNAGDRVPADLRIVNARGLRVDESMLTGESQPVTKHSDPLELGTILAERKNLAYAGTMVTGGQAESVVWAVGDDTETGRLARLLSSTAEISTPLTRKIARFSGRVLQIILVLASATFGLGVARGEKASEMFMAAVALAVGAIPEGLPAAIAVVLATGGYRMAKRRAVLRKLPAVETLGSTTVICTDKTGTLTVNQMTVQEILAGGRSYEVTGTGYESQGEIRFEGICVGIPQHPALAECLIAGMLCNESEITREDGRFRVQGDPTEAALLVAAVKGGLVREEVHQSSPTLDSIPFESELMFRATLHDLPHGRVIYKVGAPERLIERCVDALGKDGSPIPLDRVTLHCAVEEMAARGLRVLAFVRRQISGEQDNLEPHHVAGNFTFIGLQGMIDPPRPEAIVSVRKCQKAGIEVKMITGDHLVTARAVAMKIGLKGCTDHGKLSVISGHELEKLSDIDLQGLIGRTAVFARVSPEQKLRIVVALQARGHIVAMTGDGVNDAPALKQADIGVAMGISGTDVAKGAAAMILTDDNFASIEAAVEEGRGVFDNLTKFIVWIIPTNLGEALALLVSIVMGLPLPLLPLQLLWINLTDTLLGMSLAFEPKEQGVMDRPPRQPREPLLTFPLIMRAGLVSLAMLSGTLGLFIWELRVEHAGLAAGRTVAVNAIVMIQVIYLFNCRSLHRSVFRIGLLSNWWTIAGVLSMVGAQLVFTYTPVMNELFRSTPIGMASWLRIGGVAGVVFGIVEFEKWVRFGGRRGKISLSEEPPADERADTAFPNGGRSANGDHGPHVGRGSWGNPRSEPSTTHRISCRARGKRLPRAPS
ncbi:MAG: HAD family hydrolase [Verrucomicrobiaceae bacterium]|nr:MAG: HAD family hydrolase [Verrucomicrobiaceae bacterium]